jgi:hypothetical protein
VVGDEVACLKMAQVKVQFNQSSCQASRIHNWLYFEEQVKLKMKALEQIAVIVRMLKKREKAKAFGGQQYGMNETHLRDACSQL